MHYLAPAHACYKHSVIALCGLCAVGAHERRARVLSEQFLRLIERRLGDIASGNHGRKRVFEHVLNYVSVVAPHVYKTRRAVYEFAQRGKSVRQSV